MSRRQVAPLLAAVIALALTSALSPSSCRAHEIEPAVVDLAFNQPQGYTLSIRLNLEALIAGVGPEHGDTRDSPQSDLYESLTRRSAEHLRAEFERFATTFLDGIDMVESDGRRIDHEISLVTVPEAGDPELARMSIVVLSPKRAISGDRVTWSWDAGFGPAVIRVATADGAEVYAAYLTGGDASEPIPVGGPPAQSTASVFADYTLLGFTHILPYGLDHILFVVGLFLLSTRLGTLLWQVTSFTVAHTVTLALGVSGVVQLPAAVVEPLIAASIVYVGVENILTDRLQRWRMAVVFCFGLLHGLGFAGVLSDIGISKDYFATALIAFNAGVELGQLAVIAICYVLATPWFRRQSLYRRIIAVPASAVIAAVGLYWFVQRTLH